MRYRDSLPQLNGNVLLTDGGMETTLIFGEGLDLPCFASFPLLEHDEGRAAMLGYFEPYLEVARRHGAGFVLEANTWRANPAWGAQLGYSLDDLACRIVSDILIGMTFAGGADRVQIGEVRAEELGIAAVLELGLIGVREQAEPM